MSTKETSKETANQPRPLEGVRVLALEGFIAGPYASMWLGDMGAEVIKVEEPKAGDPARGLPPIKGEGREAVSLSMLRANRNKKSLTLNLKTEEGRRIFERLLANTDILLDNLRPDALEKLGFTWDKIHALNERLIYTSVSGFGHNDLMPGPYMDWPAFDVVGQAMSGLMMRPEGSDTRPVYLGFPLADLFSASLAVTGTLQALLQRGVTGKGQRVDIAMYDSALVLNELSLIMQTALGTSPKSGVHALTSPFGCYKTSDGYIAIAVLGEKVWQRFCTVIDRRDLLEDPELENGIARYAQSERLTVLIEAWLEDKTKKEAVKLLIDGGVPAAPVQNTKDIADCSHVAARDMLVEIDDPQWGPVRVVGQPIKTSGSTPAWRRPPHLGEHTQQILRDLAELDESDLERLQNEGII